METSDNQQQEQQQQQQNTASAQGETVIDADVGIVRAVISGTEHVICNNPQFPPPEVHRGSLAWVPVGGSTTRMSLCLSVPTPLPSSPPRVRNFVCLGAKTVAHFVVPRRETLRGATFYERSGHEVNISAIRNLVVESELNCLNHHSSTPGSVPEGGAFDLFNPNHTRVRLVNRGNSSEIIENFTREDYEDTTFIIDAPALFPNDFTTDFKDALRGQINAIIVKHNGAMIKKPCLAVKQGDGMLFLELDVDSFPYNGVHMFETIGGKIYEGLEATEHRSCEAVAIKLIPNYKLPGGREEMRNNEDRMKEVAAMQFVHRGASKLLEETLDDPVRHKYIKEGMRYLIDFRCAVDDGRRLHIITTMAGKDVCTPFLDRHLGPQNRVRESEILSHCDRWFSIWRKFMMGMFVLHSIGMTHLDISIENLLVSDDGNDDVVIIDYGQAVRLYLDPIADDGFTCCRMPRNSSTLSLGKCYYRPFEVEEIRHDAAPETLDAKAFDMWQSGILLAIMISGNPPYPSLKDTKDKSGRNCRDSNIEERKAHYLTTRRRFLDRVIKWKHEEILEEMGVRGTILQNRPQILYLFRSLVKCLDSKSPRMTAEQAVAFLHSGSEPAAREPAACEPAYAGGGRR